MSMRSLWVSIQGDPVFMRKLNGWLTVKWILHFPVIITIYFAFPGTWRAISILYLALVSIYANVAGHLSAWQAARVEVKQAEEAEKKDQQNIGQEVVKEMKEDPDVPV